MPKQPKKRDEIKQAAFKDRNVTMLDALKRDKNTVQNVFTKLGLDMETTSWFDECIPNLLWAAITVTALERDEALEIFRRIVAIEMDLPKRSELFITHNYLSVATPDEFDQMMAPILANCELKAVMPALLYVDWLPDREHWQRHYEPIGDESAADILMAAVAATYGHQSQAATDMRWVKLLSLIFAQDRMRFDLKFEERIGEIAEYPNKGDMKKVRPSIRSMEIMTRMTEFGTADVAKNWPQDRAALPKYDAELFWKEMYRKTGCLVPSKVKRANAGPQEACREFAEITNFVGVHFHSTTSTTTVDPRHEGAFGLVLYACHLAATTSITPTHTLAEGRIILRSILEVYITLHYLAVKDDRMIWLQYRKYGQGQTKLAFLKNIREEEIPSFIDLDELEEFANEDRWMEFADIELGHWANLNLRKMAEVAGLKDLYDKYYDWSSGYVHAQWASARSTVFINCFNPLHRFHRIPGVLAPAMPSTLVDVAKIVNRMLDDLNALYPSFKPRLTWHKAFKEGATEESDQERFTDPVLGEQEAVKQQTNSGTGMRE
ncbi:hypothetical protein G6K91_22275 [Agrobacterium rhizogenes]|nr:hypothetical protein [Rhizobium rhizogenes]NTG56198.1 hypothetical protein [Rhizobium rhizogenes]NTH01870.1 hypothetical protein [Rhizobium rhizogenes]NTH55339.1 hypothetical protein [Rhizobium rhizogenes]NTH74920.1 hypothetical protein [Rhizobium rhizogenes]